MNIQRFFLASLVSATLAAAAQADDSKPVAGTASKAGTIAESAKAPAKKAPARRSRTVYRTGSIIPLRNVQDDPSSGVQTYSRQDLDRSGRPDVGSFMTSRGAGTTGH